MAGDDRGCLPSYRPAGCGGVPWTVRRFSRPQTWMADLDGRAVLGTDTGVWHLSHIGQATENARLAHDDVVGCGASADPGVIGLVAVLTNDPYPRPSMAWRAPGRTAGPAGVWSHAGVKLRQIRRLL